MAVCSVVNVIIVVVAVAVVVAAAILLAVVVVLFVLLFLLLLLFAVLLFVVMVLLCIGTYRIIFDLAAQSTRPNILLILHISYLTILMNKRVLFMIL